MRVLLTTPVFPPDLGGPATYVPSVGRFLVERGHEVRVIAFCSDPDPQGFPFPVQAIWGGSMLGRYLRAFVAVWRTAPWADVIYVNEHLALLHVLAARLRRKPVVIRIMVDGSWEISHRKGWCAGDDIVTYQGKRYGWRVGLARFLQKRWWARCSRIIACSDFLRGILMNSYSVSGEKVLRIHNAYHGPCVDEVQESPRQARAALGLEEGPHYILTVCRLMGWKRVDGILRALAELPGELADTRLLVAGDGDMLEPWRQLAHELGLGERAIFLGNVPYEKIPLYMRASSAFVLNSEYEGLSHTLLEALHLGTPMIASGVCGNPEVVEDGVNGLLVDPYDHGTLREALTRMLSSPEEREAFVRESLARTKRFDRTTTFSRVEEVLREAAGK
ncbi:MAG TPA: glycosyltransferase family 4 protein [Planctomycetota bacterium]|jgi:glycosyltransferase involved in cell wall biosynthesis|nr:glycosyltransferase family 4 protein [Planctomycetota bacterium]